MLRRLFGSLLFCVLNVVPIHAQPPFSAGGQSASLSGAGLLLQDAWAVHTNPAMLPWLKNAGFGLWTERLYNIKNLDRGAMTAALPIHRSKGGCLGFGFYAENGPAGYSRLKLSLAYGLKFNDNISAGAGMHLVQTRLREYYGSQLTPVAEASIVYRINSSTMAGLRAWNLYPVRLAEYQDEKLPIVFQAGISQKLGKKTKLLAAVEQETGQKTNLRFGLEYRPLQTFALQGGWQTQPLSYSFGTAFLYKDLNIHIAFDVHPILGASPNLSFTYGKEQDKN